MIKLKPTAALKFLMIKYEEIKHLWGLFQVVYEYEEVNIKWFQISPLVC